jgi:hypothetical protein
VGQREVLGDLPPDPAETLAPLPLAWRGGTADVPLGDPASGPRPLEGLDIHTELPSDTPNQRRYLGLSWFRCVSI